MRIVTTFPGKHGDLLWALPTVRALAETYEAPVDLVISPFVGSLKPLLERQPYVGAVAVDEAWAVQMTAPITPREPPTPIVADCVYHLGYWGWPERPLPAETWRIAMGHPEIANGRLLVPIDLARPWIQSRLALPPRDVCEGWTDEWFELKYGLHWILRNRFVTRQPAWQLVNLSTSPRWMREGETSATDWDAAAGWLQRASVFVGCCSALHVLACAVGVPEVILVEPNPQRHHPIFYPYGTMSGPVRLLRGTDGQPTFDARHLVDEIQAALERVGQATSAASEPTAPAVEG